MKKLVDVSSWVKYHFEHLRRWREYVEKISKAVRDIIPDAEIYVIGGVAEDRITIYSDIDILIIIKNIDPSSKVELVADILDKAIDTYDLPWDAPVELHVVNEEEAKRYFKHCKKVIKIE